MARTLETLEPGTPVFAGGTKIGEVRAVYAEGDARSAEILAVRLTLRDEDVSIPAGEVGSVDEQGVHLIRTEHREIQDFAPFDETRYPTMKKLA